jgi:hypothetical protein
VLLQQVLVKHGGEGADRRVVEQFADRQAAEACGRLRGQQRMAAEREEVVVDAGRPAPEHLGEDLRDPALRRGVRLAAARPRRGRRGREGEPVGLAVGREGHGVDRYDQRRDHVGGERRGGVAEQVVRFADDVRHQRVVQDRDSGGADLRVRAEDGLDLAELDAVPAQLDLVVGAPEELERTVRPAPRPVAGAVQA